MAINWKRTGILVLLWLCMSIVGVMLIITSSQFHNKDYVTIHGIVASYFVEELLCNNGKTPCFSSFANINFGENTYCTLLADVGDYNRTHALLVANDKYKYNSSITSYRRVGTFTCTTHRRNNNTAIIGVVLITISGILILALPCYYRLLITVVIDDGGIGKVHAAESIGLTAKEAQARADAAAVAAARRTTILNNKASGENTQARIIAELVQSKKPTTVANSNEWSGISPNMIA